MKEPIRDENPWKAVGLVSAMGADLAVCTLAGYYGGKYISDLTGGNPFWMLAGVMLGLAVGVISIIFLIKYFTEGLK